MFRQQLLNDLPEICNTKDDLKTKRLVRLIALLLPWNRSLCSEWITRIISRWKSRRKKLPNLTMQLVFHQWQSFQDQYIYCRLTWYDLLASGFYKVGIYRLQIGECPVIRARAVFFSDGGCSRLLLPEVIVARGYCCPRLLLPGGTATRADRDGYLLKRSKKKKLRICSMVSNR